MRTSGEAGYALLFALWVLMVLAAFAELFLIEARQGRRSAATVGEVAKVQLLLDGAINATIVKLFNSTPASTIPLNGLWVRASILDQDIAIRVSSENGKLNINLASTDAMAMFLQSATGGDVSDPSASRELASRIAVWRNAADPIRAQSEIEPYTNAQRPYGPRFARFRSPEELRFVLGMKEASVRQIGPLITIWSGQSAIQMGVASDAMLEALQSTGNGLARSELDARQNGKRDGFGGFVQIGDAVEIEARYESDFVRMSRLAIVRISGDRRHPYEILSWR